MAGTDHTRLIAFQDFEVDWFAFQAIDVLHGHLRGMLLCGTGCILLLPFLLRHQVAQFLQPPG